jgi:hypothetical protein
MCTRTLAARASRTIHTRRRHGGPGRRLRRALSANLDCVLDALRIAAGHLADADGHAAKHHFRVLFAINLVSTDSRRVGSERRLLIAGNSPPATRAHSVKTP